MSGKGDKQRKPQVSREKFEDSWDRIFKNYKPLKDKNGKDIKVGDLVEIEKKEIK